MKKTIMILCLVVTMFAIGCDSKPTAFNPEEEGWELWREGTIDRKKIVMEVTNNREKRMFVLEFKNGDDVSSSRFHRWEEIKEGSTGYLYSWDGLDNDNTYMWIPSGVVATTIPLKEVSLKVVPEQETYIKIDATNLIGNGNKLTIKTYGWQGMMPLPPVQQTVLVKFENGLITTAYYTRTKEWKAEVDRTKLSGGIALKKIIQWKIVDLE